MVVDEKKRRSGVGRALMAAAERWAKSRGVKLLRLRTEISRADAHAFYESLGYARLKTQHVYRKPL
jgi:GNAT superfamily N-acetyltransferase